MKRIIIEFTTSGAAREYRRENGCGGWIFDDDDGAGLFRAVLFPPDMTPTEIFRHPMTRGRSGQLIGHA
jgi:hypothetical protein